MKKLFVLSLTLLLAILPAGWALAESVQIYGTVVCTQPKPIVCAAQGVIEQITCSVGDHVSAGDVIATVSTQKVYASTDGTVYLFGAPGDAMTEIAEEYGAVAYIDPAQPYTMTATAKNANDGIVRVIPGETVYLRCYKDGTHKGTGMVVKVKDGKYTVNIIEGTFLKGESVSVYRDQDYSYSSYIGRSTMQTLDIIPCTGEGNLVRFHVTNGAQVRKGDLLYETISGVFAPGNMNREQVALSADGIIAAIHVKVGEELAATSSTETGNASTDGQTSQMTQSVTAAAPAQIAELYPDDALRVVAYTPESLLSSIQVGDTVHVTCQYVENMAEPVSGTVEKISRIPAAEENSIEAQYAVYIRLSDANSFYYGMNVVVATEATE